MSRASEHDDNEVDTLIPLDLSGPVAAATIEVLYQIAQALESRYLGEILRERHGHDSSQLDLWD